MPIKPENRARYPAEWSRISREAKERAEWTCMHDGCTARQYDVGFWNASQWVRIAGPCDTYSEAKQKAADEHFTRFGDEIGDYKIIVIVLTTAHLNHQPEDCRPENLAPMCQRHHLAYDAKHHATSAYTTRRAKANTAELF